MLLASRFGLPLGRLPGDISYKGKECLLLFSAGDIDSDQRCAVGRFSICISRFRR